MSSNGVLIAEGYCPISLPILRSLGKRNIKTAVLTSFPVYTSRFSKFCQKQFLVPSTSLEKEYAKSVEKIVKNEKFDMYFPLSEWSLLPISENRERLTPYIKLPFASHESILKCFDKRLTLELALENGVPIPKTRLVKNSAELELAAQEMSYPCVVKPRWSVVWRKDCAFDRRGGFVNSASELIATYNSIHHYFPYPLIQEYVPGLNYSVAAVYNNGKPRAFCGIKVNRAWPPSGGNSCYRESVRIDPRMKMYTEKLLEALSWHGIAEVEFRLDPRDNIPKLMEINPRFWGSLCVAVKAGIDFPYLLYKIAMDGDARETFNYKAGVKGRYMEQDLLYIISIIKNSSANNTLRSDTLKQLSSWLKFYEPGLFYDLFEVNDPVPFFFRFTFTPMSLVNLLKDKSRAWSPPRISS
jgi:predicted ATP-grasp superfamily ATP-dependent carboligase